MNIYAASTTCQELFQAMEFTVSPSPKQDGRGSNILFHWKKMLCLVTRSCPTVCHPVDCSLPGSSVHGIFQARILEWVAMPSSRGIFLPQGLNTGLPHCRWFLYHLSHQGSPKTRKTNTAISSGEKCWEENAMDSEMSAWMGQPLGCPERPKEVTLRLRQEGSMHEKILEKNCPGKGNRLPGWN